MKIIGKRLRIEGKVIVKIERREGKMFVYYEDKESYENKLKEEYEKRKIENLKNMSGVMKKGIEMLSERNVELKEKEKDEKLNLNEYVCSKNCYNRNCYFEDNEFREECILGKILMFKKLKRKREKEE